MDQKEDKNPWLELKIQYGQNKGKLYNEECDRFMVAHHSIVLSLFSLPYHGYTLAAVYGAQAGIRKLGRAEGSVPDVAAVSVRLVREVEDHTGVGEGLGHPHPAGREGEPGARRAGEASAEG